MRIVPKAQYGRQLTEQSDNTRVSSTLVRNRELSPNSFYNDEGDIVTVKSRPSYFISDNRTDYQREQAKQRGQWKIEDKQSERGMEQIPAFIKFISPSTYIGPMFNSNTKSYIDNVLEGNATGNKELDTAIDIATPIAGGITKSAAKGAARYVSNVKKRAIETAMRTSSQSYPLIYIKQGIENMLKGEQGGPERLIHIGDYILRGKRVGPRGYYNSFAFYEPSQSIKTFRDRLKAFHNPEGNVNYYTGFDRMSPNLENDLIDAYLYQTPINPKYGLKRVKPDYGIHQNYISKNYPDKDIPVYEVERDDYIPDNEVIAGEWKSVGQGINFPYWTSKTGPQVDVGGHLTQMGIHNGKTVTRSQDIWKFNPSDFQKRWFDGNPNDKDLPWIRRYLNKIGLRAVDRAGTPVITRTRWTPEIPVKKFDPVWQ